MKQLELLTTDSALYGEQLEKQNRNNYKLFSAINSIENSLSHFRGYFNSIPSLNRYTQNRNNGDFAFIKSDLYYVESLKWIKSDLTIRDFPFTGESSIYAIPSIDTYYRGDSILIDLGFYAKTSLSNLVASVFTIPTSPVKASLNEQTDIKLRIREAANSKFYFVIPGVTTKEMKLGNYTLEVAAYYKSPYEGEEYVRRKRSHIFELSEFETL